MRVEVQITELLNLLQRQQTYPAGMDGLDFAVAGKCLRISREASSVPSIIYNDHVVLIQDIGISNYDKGVSNACQREVLTARVFSIQVGWHRAFTEGPKPLWAVRACSITALSVIACQASMCTESQNEATHRTM